MTIETLNETPSLAELRTYATNRCRVGLRGIPALGVTATIVGLVRSDTARDLRTLTATGASTETSSRGRCRIARSAQ